MFEPTGFSQEIFKKRYAFDENETWHEACLRVAKQAAAPEKRPTYYTDKFSEIMVNNYFVPAGRIWYGSGRASPMLLNCFAMRYQIDSKEGWASLAYDNIITSMYQGGCGTNFSDIRPEGASINGHTGSCPGPLALMGLIDATSSPIRAGGGRRGAYLFGLSLRHPDIEKFINAKKTPGVFTNANLSIVGDDTTAFLEAVRSDKPWDLSWKSRYKKTISAKSLWDTFIKSGLTSAEPGWLNRELALKDWTLYYTQKQPVITNPCGEIWLEEFGNCCLGHLVIPRFIKNGVLDFDLLGEVVRLGVRFLDNILSVNTFPLPEMKKNAEEVRRIGLGKTGLADAMAMLGLRYGSKEALVFQDDLEHYITKVAYDESVLLAVEKGPFPLCVPDLHAKSGFTKKLSNKIRKRIAEHGIRNCALITQAPTGTVSILSGNCSSGIEPIFAPAYERRYRVEDKTETETVIHPLVLQFHEEGKDLSCFVGSHEISPRDHLAVQATSQYWTDNSVSKTINLPETCTEAELSEALMEYLPAIKGTTVYREGSRGVSPLMPISLETALARKYKTKGEVDCSSGTCSI